MKKSGLLLLAVAIPSLVQAQITDNFDDGTDLPEWMRYDPIMTYPPIGTNIATFNLTNGAYRIWTYRSPNPQLGPARAGSLRTNVTYTDFYITVDIVNWNTNLNQAFGIMARVTDIGFGTSDGYAMTWDRGGGDLDISRFVNENPAGGGGGGVPVTGNDRAALVADKTYRMVFIGKGDRLTGEIYELPNLRTPLASITGTDAAFASGVAGVIVYDNASAANYAGTDTTFDNYFSHEFQPPRLDIQVLPFEYQISWPADPPNYVLQFCTDLGVNWTDITEDIVETDGRRSYFDNTVSEKRFYRLRP